MIHVLNNLPKEYDVITNELENCHTGSGADVLKIDTIHENQTTGRKKLKTKQRRKK